MPEPVSVLLAKSSLPAGGRVFSDLLRLSILPLRTVLRLQLGARSQRTVATLRVAERALPTALNTWLGDDPLFLRIAPDAWLVESALHDASDLVAAVRAGCGRRSFAVTDVSDASVTISVEGPQAAALLARGCGMDLSPAAFGAAACARTRLAQLPVVLNVGGEPLRHAEPLVVRRLLGFLGGHLAQVELVENVLQIDEGVVALDFAGQLVKAAVAFLLVGAVAGDAIRGQERLDGLGKGPGGCR